MTARRERSQRQSYPALRDFCRGYLHEDTLAEHGTALAAARAFHEDATPGERRAVASEWRRFAATTKALSFEQILPLIRDELGTTWIPATPAEIEAVMSAASGTHPH